MPEAFQPFIAWLSDPQNKPLLDNVKTLLGILAAVGFFIVTYIFTPLGRALGRGGTPPDTRVSPPALPTQTFSMTLDEYEARLKARIAEVEAEKDAAHADEKSLLQSEIAELQRRLAYPADSLDALQARVRELEDALDREGNDIGADRLKDAKAAMESGDFGNADEIFAEIEAREEIAVHRVARSAFQRGTIAAQEVRWADAAAHYARAARLDPTYDHLFAARAYAWRSGDYPAALRFGEDLVNLAESDPDISDADRATAYNEHALTLDAMGTYAAAEPLFRQAMEITGAALGTEHPDYATRLNNLAGLLRATGRHGEAEPLYRQAIEIGEATLGTDHPAYAQSLSNLAGLLEATGRYADAEPLYRQDLEITGTALGTDHPDYAISLNNLAGLLRATGRHAEAEPLYRQAIEIGDATLGTNHPSYATRLNNLAGLLRDTDRPDEAIPLYRQAVEILETALGPEHPSTKKVRANLDAALAGAD